MAQSFTEALYALKRKSQLTGNPLTQRNINALTSGYVESATDAMNAERAYDLSEQSLAQTASANAANLAEAKRQAEESSAQSTLETSAQINAANKASSNTLTGNLLNTGTSLVGTGLMTEGGRTLAGNAVKGVGNLVSNALSSSTPTTAQAAMTGAAAPAGAAATQTGGQLAAQAALTEGDFLAATSVPGAAAEAGLGGFAEGGGIAAAAIAGRMALGNILSNTGTKVGEVQGHLMEQPTLEGLSYEATKMAAEALGHEEQGWEKTVRQIHDPVGTLLKWVGDSCVIVTACTDRHSPEVEIAREYRDRFMSADQLRGYYMIAEAVMPWVIRHREFVKKQFVDRLVEYGRYHLGQTEKVPCRASSCVTRLFLCLCGFVGSRRQSFVRCNGETF